ncbi:MAG: GtrA family protein, partial [Microcoleus sp.]
ILNTLVDISIYGLLSWLSVGILIANFISTSCGMATSYGLNRSFTFKSKSKNIKKEIALFLVITAFGLWIIQPLVIYSTTAPAHNLFGWLPSIFVILIPKVCAVAVALVWNYYFYNKVVFSDNR